MQRNSHDASLAQAKALSIAPYQNVDEVLDTGSCARSFRLLTSAASCEDLWKTYAWQIRTLCAFGAEAND